MRLLLAMAALAAGSALAIAVEAQVPALQPIPALNARVTDLTGTLTAAQQAELEQKLADFEGRKGAQIAVLLVPTTAPEQIEQYSIRLRAASTFTSSTIDSAALLIAAKY